MKFGIRQALVSAAVFVVLLLALVSIDARVRERFNDLVAGGVTVSSWSDRASTLSEAVATAARHQSIENAPLLIFATVGLVLFLFMVRT